MARFFIEHPVFAWVIAILITLAGILAITRLPIEAYPDIAPPQVQISANYPGADAAYDEAEDEPPAEARRVELVRANEAPRLHAEVAQEDRREAAEDALGVVGGAVV